MTEDELERRVEQAMDALDRRLVREHSLTQEEYEEQVRRLGRWAERELQRRT